MSGIALNYAHANAIVRDVYSYGIAMPAQKAEEMCVYLLDVGNGVCA